MRAVYLARKKWNNIGLELGLTVDVLENIPSEQTTDNGERLQEVLKKWLRSPSLNPSWESLAEALKSDIVGEEGLAQKIGTYRYYNILGDCRALWGERDRVIVKVRGKAVVNCNGIRYVQLHL